MEASSVTLNDTTVPPPGAAAGSRDGSPVRHRVVLALTLVAGLALLAWTLWALRRDGALGTGAVYLGFTSVVFLGTGHLVLRLAGVDGDGVTWLGLRYVVGFAVSAFVVTLVGMSGHTGLALWPALALGVAGWGVGVWDLARRRRPRPAGSLLAGELLIGAALLRVAVEGTGYWRVTGSLSIFTQYFDLLYHLAVVKVGIDRGLPLQGWVLESGVPRIGYHPAFDTMTTVLLKGLGLPVDAAFFRIVLPVTLFGMLAGLGVLAAAWAHSRRAGLLALGFVGLTLAAAGVPGPVTAVVGNLGLTTLRYFDANPPAALAAIAGTACLALVALGEERRSPGPWILAGVLAGATTMMKANFAIVLVPGLALAFLVVAWRRGNVRPAALAGVAAAVLAAAVSYPTTMGTVAPPALGLGRLGTHLLDLVGRHGRGVDSYSVLFTRLADPLAGRGPVGDALLVLLYVVVVLLGWWLIVAVFAAWRARAAGERPFGRSPAASLAVLFVVCLATLVGLFVAQRGQGYLASWNIAWHTVQNLWWLALCAAAVALDAALRGRRPAATPAAPASVGGWHARVGRSFAVVGAVVLLAFSLHGMTAVRQVGTGALPTDLRVLLEQLDRRVPVNARVVQDYDTTTDNWVSALAGRGAVLERSSWTQWVYPSRTTRLRHDIEALYSTSDRAVALRAAREAQAHYAVVDLEYGSAPGLRAIGTVVARRGDWAVLRML